MPNQDPTQVRLAPFGDVYIAPTGSVLPTTVTTPLDAAFVKVGLVADDGVSLTPNVDTTDIKAWQSLTPVKTALTGIGLTAKFNMIQVNQTTTQEFFFGNVWAQVAGVATLNFSVNSVVQERALVIEWTDDSVPANTNRLVLGRGLFTDRDAFQLVRTDAVAMGLTFECLALNSKIGYMLSNDPHLTSGS